MNEVIQSGRRWWDSIPMAIGWRYCTHSIMIFLALVNEMRPAPHLPDAILSVVPYVEVIGRYNYHFWVICYLPVAIWLYTRQRHLFVHFLYVGGVLSLLRGVCILMTGLGPVQGADLNAGIGFDEVVNAWVVLVNPFSTLLGDAAHIYLTKDLFFSGHTSSTFLLWLYCRHEKGLGTVALIAHILVVSTVFLSHLHYTIDVIGAWAITYMLYSVAQKVWPVERMRRVPQEAG